MTLGNINVVLNPRMTIAQEKKCEEFVDALKPLASASDIRAFVLSLKELDLLSFVSAAFVHDDYSPLEFNGIEWAPIKEIIALIKAYLDARQDYSDCAELIDEIKGKII